MESNNKLVPEVMCELIENKLTSKGITLQNIDQNKAEMKIIFQNKLPLSHADMLDLGVYVSHYQIKQIILEYLSGCVFQNIAISVYTNGRFDIVPIDLDLQKKLAEDYITIHGCTMKQMKEKNKN